MIDTETLRAAIEDEISLVSGARCSSHLARRVAVRVLQEIEDRAPKPLMVAWATPRGADPDWVVGAHE
jgi:hypothetical protein